MISVESCSARLINQAQVAAPCLTAVNISIRLGDLLVKDCLKSASSRRKVSTWLVVSISTKRNVRENPNARCRLMPGRILKATTINIAAASEEIVLRKF